MKKLFIIPVFIFSFFLFGCGESTNSDLSTSTFNDPSMKKTALLQTNKGDIKIELFHDKAPTIAKNFVVLSEQDKYDNTIFHRVIENFMIQGGDFENFNGTGGKSYTGSFLPDEIAPDLSHTRGMVSMANRGPNTNGSQFFIVHKDSTFLDGNYSIFGRVLEGMEVVDAIAEMKTNANDRPLEDVVLKKVILE